MQTRTDRGHAGRFATPDDAGWRAESARRRGVAPRIDDEQFMGVVRAIAAEVAAEQRMHTEELIGEAHRLCAEAIANFNPDLCSTFANYAFKTVKRSMVRDISRRRRKDKGEKVDGGDRPTRRHAREVIGGEIVVRNGFGGGDGGLASTQRPDWWVMLTARQRSIALMMAQGLRPARIARMLGLTGGSGVVIVEDDIIAIQAELIRMHVVDESWVEDMIDEQDEDDLGSVADNGANKWTLASAG